MSPLPRWFHWPTAASTFAGLLGAGVVDLLLVAARGGPLVPALSLALGLYGAAGLVLGALAGWAVGTALAAVPGGPRALAQDEGLDRAVVTALLGGTLGALALGVGAAAAHALFVSKMNSRTLATIASGGVALALVPMAALVALAARPLLAPIARLLPRRGGLPRAAVTLVLLAAVGGLLALVALSRADWRVLDLGWLQALGIAAVLGLAHGLFWYRSAAGRRLHDRLPVALVRAGVGVGVLVLLALATRIPESSPAYGAIEDHSVGLRAGLGIARRLSDGDGDGFSARFGGGDCDDRRADTYPGAEDAPADGVDQNCEGGDARPVAAAPAAPSAAAPLKRRQGPAFDGNVLVLSIDSVRADRLGVAGYDRRGGKSLTPNLDALARRGAYFRRAWSAAPNTPRSFPSFVTSRYPSDIAWQKRTANYSPILPENETFFDHLGRAGLRPIGIFSHFYFTPDRGINKGFAEWTNEGAGTIAESNTDIASPRIVPQVVARLEKAAAAKERFVLWTHLFEPHSRYMEHKEFPVKLRGVEGLEEKYDFEIAFVDRWVGKLLEGLERAGLADRTAVVVLADHGEAFGEHKHYFHGQDLTEEQIRVPLIVAIPGRPPVVVEDEVGLIDVGPTLLDLVGLEAPAAFRGRSLLPLLDGGTLPPRTLFAELLPATAWPKHEVAAIEGGKKITHKITERRWELFDLAADPKQQRDVSGDAKHRATLEALRAKVLGFEEGRR
jgi:hypothetical protein